VQTLLPSMVATRPLAAEYPAADLRYRLEADLDPDDTPLPGAGAGRGIARPSTSATHPTAQPRALPPRQHTKPLNHQRATRRSRAVSSRHVTSWCAWLRRYWAASGSSVNSRTLPT